MNTGARLGLAVTAGYLLGRFHKMKWALTLAAIAGRGQLPGGKGGLLQQGAKLLSSSPEFTKLTDEMRAGLIDAGKAAAVAAVSNKINSLSDGLRERSDAMRAPDTDDAGSPAASDGKDVEEERHREEDGRYYDEAEEAGPVPEQRRAGSRSEPERTRASQQSRARKDEDTASHTRARHPSGHTGAAARRGADARQGRDSGQARQRTSASRTGGDRK
jgi:hypothetical protein